MGEIAREQMTREYVLSKPCSNTHTCQCANQKCKFNARCCECIIDHRAAGVLPGCYQAKGYRIKKK